MKGKPSLYGDGFREISGLIHVQTPSQRDVVGEELQQDDGQGAHKKGLRLRNEENVIGDLGEISVFRGSEGQDEGAPGFHLHDIA